MTSTSTIPCPIFSAYRINLLDANLTQDIGSHSTSMSENITPKLVLLELKCHKIIYILSPTDHKINKKIQEKTKTTKPTTQQQPSEQGGEEAIGGTNKKGDGEMRWI